MLPTRTNFNFRKKIITMFFQIFNNDPFKRPIIIIVFPFTVSPSSRRATHTPEIVKISLTAVHASKRSQTLILQQTISLNWIFMIKVILICFVFRHWSLNCNRLNMCNKKAEIREVSFKQFKNSNYFTKLKCLCRQNFLGYFFKSSFDII